MDFRPNIAKILFYDIIVKYNTAGERFDRIWAKSGISRSTMYYNWEMPQIEYTDNMNAQTTCNGAQDIY